MKRLSLIRDPIARGELRVAVGAKAARALRLNADSALSATLTFERLLELVHPGNRRFLEAVVDTFRIGDEPAAMRLLMARDNGEFVSVMAELRRSPLGGPELAVDLDEIAAARRSENQIRQIIESAQQAVTVRVGERIAYSNHALARMLGYASLAELREEGANADHVHPADVEMVEARIRARAAGEEAPESYEFRMIRADGNVIWVNCAVSLVHWNGRPASLAWLIDVTSRREMEQDLRESQEVAVLANRAKSEFLANMSHELRTPLNAIIGFSDIIAHEHFGPIGVGRYADYALDIHNSGQHLLQVLNDLLDLSKLEAGKQELRESEIALPDLVASSLRLIEERAAAAGLTIAVAVGDELPNLFADERLLKQILANLLSNAVKFTGRGGRVTVSAEHHAGDRIEISVRDTGVGMTAQEIEIALSPFGQVDSSMSRVQQGTGLGLPLARSLAELHGGSLRVESAKGVGTAVIVALPAERALPH